MVEGLEEGAAAPDDEQITLDALYRYLFLRARSEGAASTPQRFVQGGIGDLVIGRIPFAGVSQVDPEIIAALAAEEFRTRLGAVAELALQLGEKGSIAERGARLLLQRRLERERDYAVRTAITMALQDDRRPEAARQAAEKKQRVEAARRAAQEKQRAEAVRQAAEAARRAAEEKQRAEAARWAAEEKRRAEATQQAAEEKQRAEAARQAAEEKQRDKAAWLRPREPSLDPPRTVGGTDKHPGLGRAPKPRKHLIIAGVFVALISGILLYGGILTYISITTPGSTIETLLLTPATAPPQTGAATAAPQTEAATAAPQTPPTATPQTALTAPSRAARTVPRRTAPSTANQLNHNELLYKLERRY